MIDKIRKNFNEGVKSVKWIATFLAERLKAETSMAKLLYTSSRLEAKVDELYRNIGRRVLELKEKGDKAVFKDFTILEAIEEIKRLNTEIEALKRKAQALSKPPD